MGPIKRGGARPVMITGDNAYCGGYIARAANLVAKDARLFLAAADKATGAVGWTELGAQGAATLGTRDVAKMSAEDADCELAMTGTAIDALDASGDLDALLLRTRVFARTTPDQKVLIVKKHMDAGFVVTMTGDGGNDCGALRAAHAGVALSDAEASVVSPFTSKSKSIASVVDLLREGRCALATSFASYKFLITYGQLFSCLKLVCFWYGVIMCMMDYVTVDVVMTLTLTYAITLSKPLDTLRTERPTSSLLGPEVVVSVVGMQAFNIVIIASSLTMMRNDPDYVAWPAKLAGANSWWFLGDNWESTVVFVVVAFQYLTSSAIFSLGSKYRQPIWKNKAVVGAWLAFAAFLTFLLLSAQNGVSELFHIGSQKFNSRGTASPVWRDYQSKKIGDEFDAFESGDPAYDGDDPTSPKMSIDLRVKLFFLALFGLVLNTAFELVVVQGPVNTWCRKRFNCDDKAPPRL